MTSFSRLLVKHIRPNYIFEYGDSGKYRISLKTSDVICKNPWNPTKSSDNSWSTKFAIPFSLCVPALQPLSWPALPIVLETSSSPTI